MDVDHFPPPNPCKLFATLDGGKRFTKFDLSLAYQQFLLDQESAKYVMVNTLKDYLDKQISFW